MKHLLANDFFFIISFSICVSIIAYHVLGRFVNQLVERSRKNQDEMLRLLKLMFATTTPQQINRLVLLLSFGLGVVMFFLLWPHFWFGLGAGFAAGIVGWNLPVRFIRQRYEKRCDLLTDQMVDGLTIMANGVKAGLTVPQAMERVVDNLGAPLAQEFALVLEKNKLGSSVEEALLEFGERVPRPDVQMFVTANNILRETGGNLGETFTTIVLVIRERQKVEKKIEAMTAQGMMQGMIISIVPVALILLFFAVDPAFIRPMFTTALGLFIFLIICALVIIGGVTMRKVVKIDV